MSTTEDQRTSGRHPVNVVHLVMGLALLGLAAVWALVSADVVTGDDVRWLLPVPWVLAGAAGLVVAAVGARRHGQEGSMDSMVQPGVDAPEVRDDDDPAAPSQRS